MGISTHLNNSINVMIIEVEVVVRTTITKTMSICNKPETVLSTLHGLALLFCMHCFTLYV